MFNISKLINFTDSCVSVYGGLTGVILQERCSPVPSMVGKPKKVLLDYDLCTILMINNAGVQCISYNLFIRHSPGMFNNISFIQPSFA